MKKWNTFTKDIFHNPNKERDLIKNKTLNKSGIYLWHNKITDKYYIGSSINLLGRSACRRPTINELVVIFNLLI